MGNHICISVEVEGLNRWQGKALHIQRKITDKAHNDKSHVAPVSVSLTGDKTLCFLRNPTGWLFEKKKKSHE